MAEKRVNKFEEALSHKNLKNSIRPYLTPENDIA
jgi:hypothetical protein